MEEGGVGEFGPPQELLKNPLSRYSHFVGGMVQKTGEKKEEEEGGEGKVEVGEVLFTVAAAPTDKKNEMAAHFAEGVEAEEVQLLVKGMQE